MKFLTYSAAFLSLSLLSSLEASPVRQEGTFREARLILPQATNDGLPLLPIREELETKILQNFGGFTHFDGIGGWDSESGNGTRQVHHEPVWIYDIGCADNPQTGGVLKDIAIWVKTAANQESVYLRLPNGEVIFV